MHDPEPIDEEDEGSEADADSRSDKGVYELQRLFGGASLTLCLHRSGGKTLHLVARRIAVTTRRGTR
jgi:hypothetical protein